MRKLVGTLGLALLAACAAPVDYVDEESAEVATQSQALNEQCNGWAPVDLEEPKILAVDADDSMTDDEFAGHPVAVNFQTKFDFTDGGGIRGLFRLTMREVGGGTQLENGGAPGEVAHVLWKPPAGCKATTFAVWHDEPEAGPPATNGQIIEEVPGARYEEREYMFNGPNPENSSLISMTCLTDTDGGIFGGSDAGKVWCKPRFKGFWAFLTDGSTAADHIVPPPPPHMLPPEHLAPIDVLAGPGAPIGSLHIQWTPQGDPVDSYDIETSGTCTGWGCTFTTLVSSLDGSLDAYSAKLTPGAWYNVRVCSNSWGRRLCSAEAYGQARKSSGLPPRCQPNWFRCDDLSCVPRASMCEFLP